MRIRPSRAAILSATSVAVALVLALAGGAPATAAPGTASRSAAAVPASTPTALRTATGDEMTFTGHGWGHGRGMGQYGALGYALNFHWGYRQILDHYYGGTQMGGVAADQTVAVELMAFTGTELRAIGRNLTIAGVVQPNATTGSSSVKVVLAGTSFTVWTGTTCNGEPWTLKGTYPVGTSIGTASQSSFENLVRVCEPGGERGYRGYLTAQRHAVTGAQATFNHVTVEDYLRGVVPRESPDGWGNLSGGMEALKAQTVAARSYALSATRPSGATTCDTTACQVYGGATYQPWGPTLSVLDAPNANRAIDATAGEVRRTGAGAISRTEFSSSTGGYTAGGVFPAVPDEGDAISYNSRHNWSTTRTTATVAAGLGIAGIRSMSVTSRNGLGVDGGRVLQVRVVDSAGTVRTFAGDKVRSLLGLNSDWFSIAWVSPVEAQAVVKALYQDLLGRGPDPTGLAGWTNALLQGVSQSQLVDTLTRSDEYIALRVANAYWDVLGRGPDPMGAAAWLAQIRAGLGTVDDVQRRFYDSQEFFLKSGGTPEGYVAQLYLTVLGRGASPTEVQTWVTFMRQKGRAWVVDSIWFSMEAASRRAGAYYQTFLGRGPDPTGLTAWAQVLLAYGEGAVRNGIAGSDEYRARAITRYP